MRKRFFIGMLCTILLLSFGVVQAEEKTIENVSTVVGSYCHDGFVPFGAVAFGGDVVVADSANHRLVVVDRTSSKVVKTIGSYGDAKGKFKFPKDVAVLDKNLLVSDAGNKRIVILSPTLEAIDTIALKEEPVAVSAYKGEIYVLYPQAVEIFNAGSRKSVKTIALPSPATDFGLVGDLLLLMGKKTYVYSMTDGKIQQREELDGCIAIDGDGKQAYILFRESYRVLDEELKKVSNRDLSSKMSDGAIFGSDGTVVVSHRDGGKVYEFKNGNAVGSYGRGHERPQVGQVTAEGELSAVSTPQGVVVFRGGDKVGELELSGVVDLQLTKGKLFVLTRHAVASYTIGQGETVALSRERVLDANGAYSFKAMAVDGDNIYITEETSGKVLKTTRDFKALTTAIGQLSKPGAIAAVGGRIYVGDERGVAAYTSAGATGERIDGRYSALAFHFGTLYALEENRVARLSPTLEPREPLTSPGYFVALSDVNSADYGVIIGDSSRREVMGYTRERLAVTNDNISVEGGAFSGTMEQGKTLTIRVTGAGMVNPMPRIGDVRYVPDVAYIDTQVEFRPDGNLYTTTINLQNIGNYTLKVAYKKQMFISGSWQDVRTADSNPTYDLPVGVVTGQVKNQGEQALKIHEILDWLLGFFKG